MKKWGKMGVGLKFRPPGPHFFWGPFWGPFFKNGKVGKWPFLGPQNLAKNGCFWAKNGCFWGVFGVCGPKFQFCPKFPKKNGILKKLYRKKIAKIA